MFSIRRIYDDVLPLNKQAIAAVQQDRTRTLGVNARHFFQGLIGGSWK